MKTLTREPVAGGERGRSSLPRWATAAPLVVFACSSPLLGACSDDDSGLLGAEDAPDAPSAPGSTTAGTSTTAPSPSETTTTTSETTEVPTSPPPVASEPPGSPSVDGGPCVAGELPAVGAVELATGDTRWIVCSPSETYRSMIGATDEVVLVRESHELEGHVIALDPEDGTELWRWQSPSAQRPPGSITGAGVVVLLAGDPDDAQLVGVDAVTGVERWRVAERLTVLGATDDVIAVERFSDVMGAEPVRGIDRETGAEVWVSDVAKNDMSGQYGAVASSVIWHDLLIVPTGTTGPGVEFGTDLAASAIDLDTGAVAWSSSDLGTPLHADEMVIGGGPLQGPDATLHGVDPLTGRGAWSAPGRIAYGGYIAVGDGVVVANGDVGIVAYEEATGAERWRSTEGFEPHTIADGKVLSLWEAALEARSVEDGGVAWQLAEPFGSPFMNNLTTNSATVFVAINSLPWAD